MADDETLRREFADVMNFAEGGHVSDAAWEAMALGELSNAGRDALAAHIIACAECSDMYRTLRNLEEGAREFDPGVPIGTQRAAAPRSAWYAIAAGLPLLVLGYSGYRALRPAAVPVAVQLPEPAPVMRLARIDVTPAAVQLSASRALPTRGANDAQRFLEDFGRAITPYRDGQYAEAARLLAEVAEKHPDAYEPVFYRGVAALLAENLGVAAASLRRAAEIAPADLQDEIRWYRAAALQRAGDVVQASAMLRELCDGRSVWRDRACAVLPKATR